MYSKIVPVSSIAPEGWGPKEGGNATSPLHSRGSPKEGEQNQKSKPRPRVTMMHHATKRGLHKQSTRKVHRTWTGKTRKLPKHWRRKQNFRQGTTSDSKIVPVSSIAPEGWGPKEGGNATSPLHSRGSPKEGEQNQKSKPRPGVTMMHHATKRGFKDCPGFLNSTGRLGPKRGRKCYVTPAFSGVHKRRGTKSEAKTYARGHHDAPRNKACIQRLSRFHQ